MQFSLFIILIGILSFGQSQFTGYQPGTNNNPCASHTCPQNHRCVVQQVSCFNPPCNSIATCQPFDNRPPTTRPPSRPSCNNIRCGFNQFCTFRRVNCFRGPCYPVPVCRNLGPGGSGRPIGY